MRVTFKGLPSLIGQIKGNNLTTLAVGTGIRSLILPNVPTISESGYKRFETSQCYGLLAPAGTPVAIVERL
ncbi:MAG: hypothetical protein K9J38_11090 [Polynucleobacter sp.]|nr:hypothetical protein [Polynucleobacter sp.]